MSLWEETLQIIKKELKETTFKSWIQPIKPIEEEDGKIVLSVPNKFQKEFIETNYNKYIKNALKQITKKDISILFTISKNEKNLDRLEKTDLKIQNESKNSLKNKKTLNNTNSFFKKYTFENFVVGDSNRIAYSAVLNTTKQPAVAYNPLFIFGKRGVGKTHLIQSVGNYINQNKLAFKVKYTTVDEFLTDYVNAINIKNFSYFIDKYRNNDILLIDDINLLPKTEKTQTTFLDTFNHLYLSGKQIILTSDRPPKELNYIQSRLINRFEQGLVVEIQSPDLELRQKILRKIANDKNIQIDSKYINYIASKIKNDIRELEGAMNRLLLEIQINKSPITFDLIDNILYFYIKEEKSNDFSLQNITKKICEYYKIPEKSLKEKRKTSSILIPRQLAMYIASEYTNTPVTEIAKYFDKTHSSVIHSTKKIKEKINKDITIRNNLDKILADLKENF